MTDGEWYYCLKHHAVEPYDGCKSEGRLGPYATQADAAAALDIVRARNEDWETDPRFNDLDDAEDRQYDSNPFND